MVSSYIQHILKTLFKERIVTNVYLESLYYPNFDDIPESVLENLKQAGVIVVSRDNNHTVYGLDESFSARDAQYNLSLRTTNDRPQSISSRVAKLYGNTDVSKYIYLVFSCPRSRPWLRSIETVDHLWL